MKLSNDEVREIALEARLTLDDAELEKAARYINNSSKIGRASCRERV